MYINEVISYGSAWNNLNENHKDLLADLDQIIENLKLNFNDYYLISEEGYSLGDNVLNYIGKELINLNWENKKKFFRTNNETIVQANLGYRKNNCFLRMMNSQLSVELNLMSWIYNDIELANKNIPIDIPILVILDFDFNMVVNEAIDYSDESNKYRGLKPIRRKLQEIAPLKFEYPFLIIGVRLEENEISVTEIESLDLSKFKQNIKIERSIEFKPEHYQAGLGILSYFGTVMRKKHSEQNAKVKIEQEEDRVRLIVESENGDKEVIERAFDEFGLVIHQDMKPEEFYDNYLDVAELKTKLGIFETELKFQHQLVEMKEHRIIELKKDKEFLKNVIGQALVRPNSPIYINNQLNNTQSTVINHKTEFTKSNDELEDLIDLAESEALKNRLATIQNALEVNRNADQPEEVKDSSGMKKLAKFLKDANEVGTEANTLAEKGGKALDLIKSLGRRYNSIAEWCGMPNIPTVFVKE